MAFRISVDLFSFEDCHSYLRVVLRQLRTKHKIAAPISYLASQAKYRSPSGLSMYLNKKRKMSPMMARQMVRALGLKGLKKKYFLALVRLENASKESELLDAKAELMQLRTLSRKEYLKLTQFRFLDTWYYPALYVLLGVGRAKACASQLHQYFLSSVCEEEVMSALDDLVELGLVKNVEGRYLPVSQMVSTPDDDTSIALYRYHKQMNYMADKAMELAPSEREMNGLTIAIPEGMLDQVKQAITKFRKDLNVWLSSHEKDADRVYQINLQLFPLTKNLSTTTGDQ